ncbi:MAG: thioesterase family protein [Eubacterium sp.]|nr:thioesterase family protein [Eubacterium sp.]
MLTTGIKGKQTIKVTQELTAEVIGSGELPVYSTPAMIALCEETAWKSVSPELEEGQGTVGTLVNISHISATYLGGVVTCETELTEIDRKRLVFEVTVSDEAGKIAEGKHERFIIDNEKFLEKAKNKNN